MKKYIFAFARNEPTPNWKKKHTCCYIQVHGPLNFHESPRNELILHIIRLGYNLVELEFSQDENNDIILDERLVFSASNGSDLNSELTQPTLAKRQVAGFCVSGEVGY